MVSWMIGDTPMTWETCDPEATGTFDAIAEYEAAGGSFAVCTGRDLGSARGVLKGLDIDRMPGPGFSTGFTLWL